MLIHNLILQKEKSKNKVTRKCLQRSRGFPLQCSCGICSSNPSIPLSDLPSAPSTSAALTGSLTTKVVACPYHHSFDIKSSHLQLVSLLQSSHPRPDTLARSGHPQPTISSVVQLHPLRFIHLLTRSRRSRVNLVTFDLETATGRPEPPLLSLALTRVLGLCKSPYSRRPLPGSKMNSTKKSNTFALRLRGALSAPLIMTG